MPAKYENLQVFEHLIADSTAAADKITFAVPFKCRVYRVQILQTVSEVTTCTVEFDKQPTIGSANGRGAGDIGSIVFPGSDKLGYCYYDNAARGTILYPGDGVVIKVTTGSTGDKGLVCQILYDYVPEVEANDTTNMVETA